MRIEDSRSLEQNNFNCVYFLLLIRDSSGAQLMELSILTCYTLGIFYAFLLSADFFQNQLFRKNSFRSTIMELS